MNLPTGRPRRLRSDNYKRSRNRKRKQRKQRKQRRDRDATAPITSQEGNQISNGVLGKRYRRNTDHGRYLDLNLIIEKMRSNRSRYKKEGFVNSMSISDPDSDSGAESDGNATSPPRKKAKTVKSLPDESEIDSDPEFQPTVSRRHRKPSSSQRASSPQRRSASFDEQGLTLTSNVESHSSPTRAEDPPSSTPPTSRPEKNPNSKPSSSYLLRLEAKNNQHHRQGLLPILHETEERLARQERGRQEYKRKIDEAQAQYPRLNVNRTVSPKQAAVGSNKSSPGAASVKPRNQGASADESSKTATRKDTQKGGAVSSNELSSQATVVKPRTQGSISQQGNGQIIATTRDKSGVTNKPVSKTPTANPSPSSTVQPQAPTNNVVSANAPSSHGPMTRHVYPAMQTEPQ
ncbi:hypothetical protein PHISCL_04633 [Aspergillus sclerotialis]|uniref:Uncharacterized protein n=1 Tax=Aspergillus sclerotialis TaxID=2070753 RepID=A0A3A2ZIQ3_9EURO|nr:hypothetical protein PHISCL_04633 [Aspergillus sclerotialis]